MTEDNVVYAAVVDQDLPKHVTIHYLGDDEIEAKKTIVEGAQTSERTHRHGRVEKWVNGEKVEYDLLPDEPNRYIDTDSF